MACQTVKGIAPWWLILCCLAAPSAWPAALEGTWQGTLACDDLEYAWVLMLQHRAENQYRGESQLQAGDLTGHHRVTASFNPERSHVTVKGDGWIQALPKGKQVRFKNATFDAQAGTISGKIRRKACKPFVLTRTSSSATLSYATAEEPAEVPATSKKDKREKQRTPRQHQQPEPVVDCGAALAWSRIIEEAYPDTDFNRPYYNRMSDLFLDEHFMPVFGTPFTRMDETTRKALWQGGLSKCFRSPELAQAGNWQRRSLARPFISPGRDFSFDDVVLHLQQRTANRDWLAQASRTLAAGDGSEEQLRQLAAEGKIRMIGLWPTEIAAFRAAADAALGPVPNPPPDPDATHLVYPDGNIQSLDKIIPVGKSLGDAAASMYACGFQDAIQFKTAYLEQVTRLAPTRLLKAENAFDESFETTFTAQHRCPLREQLAAPHLSDVDQAYARLDNLLNARRSDARGETREPDNPGVPPGFYMITLRNDDPEETFARKPSGAALTAKEVLAIGQAIGHAVINLRHCGTNPPEREYRAQFISEAQRLIPRQAAEAGKSFDRGVKSSPFGGSARGQASRDPCAAAMIAQYERTIADFFQQLQSYSAVTRATLIAEAEAEAGQPPLKPGIHDPELFASIEGEPDEVNRLGRGLPALESGVIWRQKYARRYAASRGPMYARNLRYLMVRRSADATETTDDLVAGLTAAKADAEIDLFMDRHLGIGGDKLVSVAARFFALAMTRKIEIKKHAEYEQIVKRASGVPKAAGAIGELEIMQAYIRSLWMISEMTRIFSPHSIGIQNPYMLWHSQYVITIVAAQVHGCEQMKAYTYHCDFSFRMDVEPAPRAEGHSDSDLAFRTRLSRLLSAGQMVRQQGRIRYHPEDEWWYSPDVIERHQEAIRQALEEARQKAMTYELEPPPD